MKRIFSLLLSAALLLTCIPLSLVFAVMFVEEEHTLEAEETAGKER